MTLYEFNLLNKNEKIITVFDKGVFLDNYISKTETLNCYAIDMFFVEVVFNSKVNQIVDVRSFIDGYFLNKYKDVKPNEKATLNSETIAWALDRLSILALKIFHMFEEVNRESAEQSHKVSCQKKLDVLNEQKLDLSKAIDQLIDDIEKGNKYMKIYKQMKMYNDEELNPVLYKAKK